MADEERVKGTDTTEGGGKGAGATIKKTIVQMSKRIRRDFSIVERPWDRGNISSVAEID